MSARRLPHGKTTNRMMVHDWNRQHPIGTKVRVTKDDDSVVETVTLCEAWLVGEHTAVVLVDGISGAYALARVEAIP